MAVIQIDGREYEVKAGENLLQTCLSEMKPYLNTRDMLRLLDERLATSA